MPLISVNAQSGRLFRRDGGAIVPALKAALSALPAMVPIVVLVHGYRFSPSSLAHDPHEHILAGSPTRKCWKALSWPTALGLTQSNDGLAIAFGWEARGTIWQAYDAAREAGQSLADLVKLVRSLHKGPVSILTHSLGARVALQSLPWLERGALERVLLLAGAETRNEALSVLGTPCGRSTEFMSVTSGENEIYDFMLERLLRQRTGSAIGAGMDPETTRWLDIRLDNPQAHRVITKLGYPLGAARQRVCHWSVYLRPGVFDFYRDVLLQSHGLPHALLRAIFPCQTSAPIGQHRKSRMDDPLPVLESAPFS